jgi:hypothetical protein
MTLVVEMRPIATPHTDLCGMATASAFRSDSEVCRVINLHWHSSGGPPRKPMMQLHYSVNLLEAVCTLCRQLSRLPNHTSVRCPS